MRAQLLLLADVVVLNDTTVLARELVEEAARANV